MKRLLVSDTHLGLYSDSEIWLDVVLNFYKYIVKYCYKNDIRQIIHLGDFFNNRKTLNTKTQHYTHRIAKVLELSKDLHTYIIVGNHDCYYKNLIHPNTLELFKKYEHISVIDEPTLLDDIMLVPWKGVPEKKKGKYCMGHFAIKGFYMNDNYKCKDGLDPVYFSDYEKVYSGHFHTPSSNGNIIYLGAPYGQTFNDAGGVRGFYIFDDGKLDFIEYKDAPKFVKLYTNSEPLDENEIKGNVVRIIFTKDFGTTQNQSIIDNVIKCKPFLYSVNYSNIDSDGKEATDEMTVMDSKEQIVSQYIDKNSFPVNINISTLKAMFNKLMRETGQKEKNRSADGTKVECLSVGFKNFLSFGNKWQEIELRKGVNFVTGIDKDKDKSNGAGKSSFLETIPFALFGKTARDIKQDQIVNWKNKKNCEVSFKLNIDVPYEIRRGLKPNTLDVFKDGDLIDKDAHKTDYQANFENIFGMDSKSFMSLIHSNLNNSANIMGMKKPEKRAFLERMFGLEIYSEMNKMINEKLRGIQEKFYKIDTDIKYKNDVIESCIKSINKLKDDIKTKELNLKRVDVVKKELNEIKEKYPTIDTEINEINKEIEEKGDNFRKVTLQFEKWKAKLDAEVSQLTKEIKKIEDQEEQRKKNSEIQERIKKIEQKSGSVTEIRSKLEALEKEEKKVSQEYDEDFVKVSDIEKSIVEFKTDLKNVTNNLEQLKTGICPTCGQDVKDPATHYKKEQTSLKQKIAKKENELSKVKEKKNETLTKLTSIREDKKTLEVEKDSIYRLKNSLKEVGSEEEKDSLVNDKNEKIKKINEVWEKYKENDNKHSKDVEVLKSKVEKLMSNQKLIKDKEREYEIVKTQAEEIEKNILEFQKMINDKENESKTSKKKIKEFEELKKRHESLKDYLDCIKDILKDENIKQFSIKLIMPFLNKQVNYYLSEVNYSFYVKIDKWLDIEIKGPGVRNASYDNLSGGERRGIDIALQLSLLDIARTQAGIFPDLLVLDELLDSSIDSKGICEIMKIIKVKQKEFKGRIFIISHRDEIDSDMADNHYHVVKEDGYSKVSIIT